MASCSGARRLPSKPLAQAQQFRRSSQATAFCQTAIRSSTSPAPLGKSTRSIVPAARVPVRAQNWRAWRGQGGRDMAHEKPLPQRWGTNENVRWRTPLPERGNSPPIVWGNRVFVTQAIEREKQRALLCFDRATGRLLWQRGPTVEATESTHETNPQCSSSPVTDGERVVAWLGSAGLF